MSLPVIKAKTFDYGNYSRPQQIKYRSVGEGIARGMQQGSQAIASAILTSSSIKADAIRAKKKLDEELTIHQDRVLTNLASQLGADFASKNEDIIAKMVDDYVVMPNDSREVRNQKILGFQNEFEKLKSIADYQKMDNPLQNDADLVAGNSSSDYFAQGAIRNGYVELDYDEKSKTIKTFIPRVNFDGSKALRGIGAAAGISFDKEEVDVSDIISRKISLKYDSVSDIREAGLELTPEQLQSLRITDTRFNNAITTSVSDNGQIITSYDPVKLKTLLLNDENPTGLNRRVDKLVKDKAETIWEEKIRFAGDKSLGDFDGSDEQVDMVKEFVVDDLVNYYSRSALSIETPKAQSGTSTGGGSDSSLIAQNFFNEYLKGIKLYNDSIKANDDEIDILPLRGVFRLKNHNRLGLIVDVISPKETEGSSDNDNVLIFKFRKGDKTFEEKVDLTDKNEFDNFISEIGFVDSATANQKVIEAIKSQPNIFGLSEQEQAIKTIQDAEDKITPETLDLKQNLVEDRLLETNREFRQRQLRDR
tara:strand:+ start:1114 stop:2715 length:1602 start_codon:yes stop_codon:yes gene_type:complete